MIIGMGVVFSMLFLLSLATGLLEWIFRPKAEREPDLPSTGQEEAADVPGRRRVALVAVGLYLQDKERAHVYVPLRTTGEQWKSAGRLKSLRG